MTDQNLLDILQAHGERFLDSFSLPSTKLESKKRARADDVCVASTLEKISYNPEEEWGGITEELVHDGDDSQSEIISHDEFTAVSSYTDSKVVVFQDTGRSTEQSDSTSRSRMKAFMSSRISKLRQDDPIAMRKDKTEEELENERTNAQNDAILHRLIHTKLLSGSLNPDFDMTPAQRRKALDGRVLELTGAAKIGKGEKSVRAMERNKASKRVRDGLKEKQKQRARQQLEEAKDLGNYHPTLKRLFEDTEDPSSIEKRERGLKMGIGKFRGGFLRLGQEDFRLINGAGRGDSRGRRIGGKRGRGRGG